MIWNLLLAHFAGDFLLQTDWIARKKENFWVFVLHITILLSLMILLAGNLRQKLLPYLFLIAATHFIQDRLKMTITIKQKQHRVLFFFIDQLIHILIILGVVAFFEAIHGPLIMPANPALAIIALVLALLTQVWFITERVIYAEDKTYIAILNQTKYARMITRTSLTGLMYLAKLWVFPALMLAPFTPYPETVYRKRAMLTDLCVSVFCFLFLYLALG